MFEQTKSFWRRLLHSRSSTAGAGTVAEERRSTARFPADGQVHFQVANTAGAESRTARVRNISQSGVNLMVDCALSPGDLLNLQLAENQGANSKAVLACVVHVTPEGENQWSLGCTFARDLTAGDLAPFTQHDGQGSPIEQRATPRFTSDIQASYQRVSETGEKDRPASVLNISNTGVGLLTRESLTPGTLLSVTLGPARTGDSQTILSCVVHASGQQDGQWALGCNFITEVPEADLQLLLPEPARIS